MSKKGATMLIAAASISDAITIAKDCRQPAAVAASLCDSTIVSVTCREVENVRASVFR